MERLKKIVLEAPPEGMHYSTSQGENGELIVWLDPNNSSETSQAKEPLDKAQFFVKITAKDRKKVREWLKKQEGKTGLLQLNHLLLQAKSITLKEVKLGVFFLVHHGLKWQKSMHLKEVLV